MARVTQESPGESEEFLSPSSAGTNSGGKERSRDVGSITARHFFSPL